MSSYYTMFRSFAVKPVLATKTVVKKPVVVADPGTAILSWGVAGDVPAGVRQEDGADLSSANFEVNMNDCKEEWKQVGMPVTEEKRVYRRDGAGNIVDENQFIDLERITEIQFRHAQQNRDGNPATNAYVADAVLQSAAEWKTFIPGNNNCDAKYKMKWGD